MRRTRSDGATIHDVTIQEGAGMSRCHAGKRESVHHHADCRRDDLPEASSSHAYTLLQLAHRLRATVSRAPQCIMHACAHILCGNTACTHAFLIRALPPNTQPLCLCFVVVYHADFPSKLLRPDQAPAAAAAGAGGDRAAGNMHTGIFDARASHGGGARIVPLLRLLPIILILLEVSCGGPDGVGHVTEARSNARDVAGAWR